MTCENLTPKEQLKYDVAKETVELHCSETAIRRGRTKLGCTRKTLLKYVKWYQDENILLFSHGNKGRKPSTTTAEDTRAFIKNLYKEKYYNASFTHFMEILKEDYAIVVSDGTLHSILKEALLVSPCSKKITKRVIEKKLRVQARKENLSKAESEHINTAFYILDGADAHPRKPRSKYFGELIQMDASELIWVPGRIKWHLHVAIDDATSEVVGAHFDYQETLEGYYRVLYMILKVYGIPARFRTDRRTVFEYSLLNTADQEKDTFTQFSAACQTLGIELEASSVPQHKARVERLNRTLQGRLPVEFSRHNITTIEAANAFLWDYLPQFNAQFSLKDEKDLQKSTFLNAPCDDEINSILAVVSRRVIDAGSSIKYHNVFYMPHVIQKGILKPRYFVKGTKAYVIKAFDGTLLANIKDEICILKEIEKRKAYSKEFDITPKERTVHKPAPDHPWRSQFYSSNVLERHIAKSKEEELE